MVDVGARFQDPADPLQNPNEVLFEEFAFIQAVIGIWFQFPISLQSFDRAMKAHATNGQYWNIICKGSTNQLRVKIQKHLPLYQI